MYMKESEREIYKNKGGSDPRDREIALKRESEKHVGQEYAELIS